MSDSPADADDFVEFANLFLKEHSPLFTVLGIFGAVSVYLSTITADLSANLEFSLIVGPFSSLLLFVLVALLINEDFKDEYEEYRGFSVLALQRENTIPALSLVLFDSLLASVFVMVITVLRQSWVVLFSLIFAGLLFHFTLIVPPYLAFQTEKHVRFPFERLLCWTNVSLILLHFAALGFLGHFVFPNLPPDYHDLISVPWLAIAGSLFVMLYLSLRSKVENPWS